MFVNNFFDFLKDDMAAKKRKKHKYQNYLDI
jgi:hypothetical protein